MKRKKLLFLMCVTSAITFCFALTGCREKNTAVTSKNNKEQKKPAVKVSTLIDNANGENNKLKSEHGLSIFIETKDAKILFDTGKDNICFHNAKEMNLDLSKTDYLVLSHAHYDHGGGVKKFFEEINPKAKLYVGNHYFFDESQKYHYSDPNGKKLDFSNAKGGYKYIGVDFDKEYLESKDVSINYVDSDMKKISDQVTLFTNFKESEREKISPSMKIKQGDTYVQDTFKEEQALAIDTNDGLVIITGCSHKGIINIVTTIKERTGKDIYAVIGGTHLIESDEATIKDTIKQFKEMGIKKVGLSHCTGEKAVNIFKEEMSENSFVNCTGKVLEYK